MLDGSEVVYLDRVETAWPLRMTLQPGSRVPLHCTASGKLLLASLPAARRRRLVATLPLERYTERTLIDANALEAELARIRRVGYATDNEEYLAGLVCVAVPVTLDRRRTAACIAVHAPLARMPLDAAIGHLPALRRARRRNRRHVRNGVGYVISGWGLRRSCTTRRVIASSDPARIMSLAFSAIITTGALVLPDTSVGMIEQSTTRRPRTPCTRNRSSTTAIASRPMLQVPDGWKIVAP